MNGIRTYSLLLALALALLPSCEKQGGAGKREVVPVQLAFCVGPTVENRTKGNPGVITEMADNVAFRGMTGVTLLPFGANRPVEAGDQTLFYPSRMSDISQYTYSSAIGTGGNYIDGLVQNNGAHLYSPEEVSFPGGTASVLAYGYAPLVPAGNEILTNHLNGALEITGMDNDASGRSAGDIRFEPVPILPDGLPDKAQKLADILNDILVPGIQYQTTFWYLDGTWKEEPISISWNDDIGEATLRECYLETLNNGHFIPGSGRSVEYIISRLYRRLREHVIQDNTPVEYIHGGSVFEAKKQNGGSEPLTWGDLYRGLRDAVTLRIASLHQGPLTVDFLNNSVELADATLRTYPGSLGLPEGAAILRWNGTRFYPVEDTTGESAEGIAPVTSLCYPPRLCYFANSTLSTSSSDRSGSYTSEKMHWTDILDEYRYGKVVSGTTQAVALDQPLQFSCGMLIATVAVTTDVLDDGDGDPDTTIPVGNSTFPVTGIIIGSQQRLNFDFTPAGGRSLSLYDNCISGVYAKTVPPQGSPDSFRSFVSQTPAGENVYICLELRNNSGKTFTGADGIILPGGSFYLVGNIELGVGQSSVFLQDHTTTIHCRISSLAEARNAIPNLEQPHLALGILISASWNMSTPGHVILS